ncbi:hypothetical protein SAMN04488527_16410 [Aliiroseovarius crassostreae]|nr:MULTISPECIES: hypothetical protein [Rhodobacterales]UTS82759.1 hypothetical protein OL67_003869 [Phaeobacter piscinae]SFU98007.1 hypothetical protein SAMN04488527_16410 [Aliiroseovarius crassostreae]
MIQCLFIAACLEDMVHEAQAEEFVLAAEQQVEVYLAEEPKPDLLDALVALAERDLVVSILVSPDVPASEEIVAQLQANFRLDAGEAPTICELIEPAGPKSIVVIDHISYREDFSADRAMAMTLEPNGDWEIVRPPISEELAKQTEALSGTCRI